MSDQLSIITWNVNGIRAILKKEFPESISAMDPDILMLQETKASEDQVKEALDSLSGTYQIYANESKGRKGYSGTAVLTKVPVKRVAYDMDMEEHDQEGRVVMMEFDSFYLVNVYTPNSGRGLSRLDYREKWDQDFKTYLQRLGDKPVLVGGDLNVAHQPIDLANPKSNYNKTSGYTQVEIDGLSSILEAGFTDVFRSRYPEAQQYTYWNYMFNARARDVGWRIDYFLATNGILDRVIDVRILNAYLGSDHCPVEIILRNP